LRAFQPAPYVSSRLGREAYTDAIQNTCLANFNTGTNIDNCAVSNAACVCADTDVQSGWACCLSTGCNAADAASVIGVMKNQCPDSPNIGTCAANIVTGQEEVRLVLEEAAVVEEAVAVATLGKAVSVLEIWRRWIWAVWENSRVE
jgi:hypothetical protein